MRLSGLFVLFLAACCIVWFGVVGCGEDTPSEPERDTTPPPPPTNLTVTQQSQGFALDWDIPLVDGEPVPDLRGYRAYRDPTFSATAKQDINEAENERAPEQDDFVFVLESNYLDRSVVEGGSYKYTVTAIDDSLNESDSVESAYYTYDTGSPLVTITSPVTGYVTNVPTISVAGTVVDSQDVSTANIYVNDVVTTQASVVAGAFSSQVTLSYGDNILTAEATDPNGNVGISNLVTVTLDTSAVVIQIISPQDGELTNQERVEVSGAVSDPDITQGTLIVNGNESSIVIQNGSFGGVFADLDEGTNAIEVRASNQAGSTGSSGIVRVTRDSQQPAVYLIEPVDGATVQESPIYVSGTVTDANPPDSVSLSVSGDVRQLALVQGQFQAYADLQEGSNTIIVTAMDLAGNTGSASASVTLNSEGPIVRITTPQDGALLNDPNVNVGGTVSDPNIESGNLFIDGVPQNVTIENGIFLEAVTLGSDGSHSFWAEVTDDYGRTGVSDTVEVTLDTTPPQIVITTPADGSMGNVTPISVAGTVDDEEVEEVMVYVNSFGVDASVTSGVFSTQVSLAEGWNDIYAEGSDVSQNIGRSDTVAVLLDTQAEIAEIDHDAGGEVLEIGDHVLFWLDSGEADGEASVDIEDIHSGIMLYDDGTNGDTVWGDGKYYRDYTVQAGDEAFQAQVIGHFTDHVGNVALDQAAENTITINAPPVGVTLVQPSWTEVTSSRVNLRWSASTSADFRDYRLFRHTSPGVDTLSTLVVTITDAGQDTVYYTDQDATLTGGATYYYKVYVRDILGASVPSNEVNATIDDWPSDEKLIIPTGDWPTYMAAINIPSTGPHVVLTHMENPPNGEIRIINHNTDAVVNVLDESDGVVGWTVGVNENPYGEVLVAGWDAHKIYRISGFELDLTGTIDLAGPVWGVGSGWGPDTLYGFAGLPDSIAILNLSVGRVDWHIPTYGVHYADFGQEPNYRTIYATSGTGMLATIDTWDRAITGMYGPYNPIQRSSVTQDYIFLAHNDNNSVTVINRYNLSVEEVLSTPAEPVHCMLLPGGEYLYISCRQAEIVSVFDTQTWQEIDRIEVGLPLGLLSNDQGNKIYVTRHYQQGGVVVLKY